MVPIPNLKARPPTLRANADHLGPESNETMSKTTTIAKMRPDGSVCPGAGRRQRAAAPRHPNAPDDPQEVEEAARSDPDARPMIAEQLPEARRIPRIKTLRRALNLTQEEFATRYRIPLRHLARLGAGPIRARPTRPCLPHSYSS